MLEPDVGGWMDVWMDGWLGIGPRKTDRIPIGKLFVCILVRTILLWLLIYI